MNQSHEPPKDSSVISGKTSDQSSEGDFQDAAAQAVKPTLFGSIRAYFITGIVVTAPITITLYLTWVFITFVDRNVEDLIPEIYNPNQYLPFSVPGLGLFVAAVFFIAVGWLARNFLGKLIIRFYEYVLHRMPVISTVYGAFKQIFETISASQSQAFREVVLLEYPRKGVYSVGFVTGKTKGTVAQAIDKDTVNVFVPTTPNPTSGYLLFVPKEDLHYLDLTIEEGVKLVVSAGIITPPDK